ncbi:MAG: DoxX family protein [Nocardioidaceae bacterium]|nr:DoxX family protein [Nocardioidaceae bacterium]
MTSIATARPRTSTTATRVGVAITALVSAFLAFDAVIHVLNIDPVVEGSHTLGFDPAVMPYVGVLEAVCLALYLIRRTSPIGAVLLTGYLGGAFCAQLRIEAPLFSTLLFPIYTGVLVWAGLYLRDRRVRDLVRGR